MIGVRSSWLTLDTNASFTRSTSRSCSTACRSVSRDSTSLASASSRSVMSSEVLT